MPIKPASCRWFYHPIDWPQVISRQVRFERAGGRWTPNLRSPAGGETVRCLPDGRWYGDPRCELTWRSGRGRPARWPDIEEATLHSAHAASSSLRRTSIITRATNRPRNLKSLCQRCHLIHDRPHHLAQRRITLSFLRRALGDLFLGPYHV